MMAKPRMEIRRPYCGSLDEFDGKAMASTFSFTTVWGVDFSGAKLAGRNIWIAETRAVRAGKSAKLLELIGLQSLQDLSGHEDRGPALKWLVEAIGKSEKSLWGIDFPFGLPIELTEMGRDWEAQLRFLATYAEGAAEFGRWCVAHAKRLGDKMHIRRETDTITKTPFDCYHYRIIYQTFHGMRDVLLPLRSDGETAVLPFDHARVAEAKRVVVEACPGSTLKRLGLPHQNYKQPAGGALTARRRATRQKILAGLDELIAIPDDLRRRMMRNPGGDALDAVIAAVGVYGAWRAVDEKTFASHERFAREGYVYA